MQVSRRNFLTMVAASAVVPLAAPQALVSVVEPVEAIAPLPAAPEFGYTMGESDGWYMTGFKTQQAAYRQALAQCGFNDDSRFTTARIEFYTLEMPSDLAGSMACAMLDQQNLNEELVCQLQGANEEGDYEGDFNTACANAPMDTLDVSPIMARALGRIGRPEWVGLMERSDAFPDEIVHDHPDIERICEDQVLETELRQHLLDWAELHGLAGELRSLHTHDVETHIAPTHVDEYGNPAMKPNWSFRAPMQASELDAMFRTAYDCCLYYYGGPMMWFADHHGQTRLWTVINQDKHGNSVYLSSPISIENQALLEANQLSVYDANKVWGCWIVAQVGIDQFNFSYLDAPPSDEILPAQGVMLRLG